MTIINYAPASTQLQHELADRLVKIAAEKEYTITHFSVTAVPLMATWDVHFGLDGVNYTMRIHETPGDPPVDYILKKFQEFIDEQEMLDGIR